MLNALFDTTRDGILATDPATRLIVYANPAMCRMLGYDKWELPALTLEDLLGGELSGVWFARILAGETVAADAVPVLRKDGARIHLRSSVSALAIEGRQFVLGVFEDATSQEMTAPALRQSEERLDAVLDAGDLGFFDWDLRTGEVYFSPRYYTLLGYEPGAFPASWEAFAKLLHPEDMELIQAVIEDYSANRRERHSVEVRLKSKSGDWLWILSRGKVTAREEDGRPRRMIGTRAGVTWRKAVEQELRIKEMALASAVAGVAMADLDGRLTYANQAWLDMHGHDTAAGVLGTTPLDHVEKPSDAQAVIEAIRRRGKWMGELSCRRRDGTTFPAEVNANTVLSASGEPLCMLASFQDITERRRAEQSLRLSETRLRQAQEIAQVGNWDLDLTTGYLWWSDEIFRLFELDPAVFGASYEAFLAAIHPDDRAVVDAAYKQSLQDHTPYMVTHRLLLTDRRVKYVEERCVSDFAADGTPLRSRGTVQDVTARVEAEAALKAARDELEATLQAIPDLLFEMDAAGRYLAFRAQKPELLAAPGEQLLRRSVGEVLPAEASATVLDAIREASERGVSFGRTIHLNLPAGGRWFELSVARKAAVPGRESTFIVLSRDVTERTQAEEEVIHGKQRYFELVENIHDGIIRDDLEGRLTFANRRFREWFGLDGKEITKVVLEDYIAPEWQQIIRDWHDRRVRGEPSPDHYECCGIRPGGEPIWFEVSVTTVVELGQIVGTQSAVRDITERKRTEAERERLMTAIQQSGEAILITDSQGTIEYANPAFTQITGYSGVEALGQNSRVLLGDKHDEEVNRELWSTITGGRVWRGHMVNRRKDGTLLTLDVTISPVRDPVGQIVNYVEVMRDITDEVILQQQFQQAQKMESIGRLAGGVAHDFNNLLTVINGHSDLMLAKLDIQDPIYEGLAEVRKAGERAAALTQQLLAFCRKQVIQPVVLDLNAVVRDVEKMLGRVMGEDVELITDLKPDLGRIRADTGQITQVLMNLAVNARDAMPSGGRLRIETENVVFDEQRVHEHLQLEPGAYVQLTVHDTGAGMDEATRAHIFEPFFTTKATGAGTGLGLSTVYGIVRQAGGHIHVASEPECGTTFKIWLPRLKEAAVAAEPEPPAGALKGSETILVVEDQKDVHKLARLVLNSYGYKVLEAANAAEALLLAESSTGTIDLVVTDVIMPGTNGRELAGRLRPLRPGLKVLFMSGYAEDVLPSRERLDQGIAFLQKPFTPEELARKVRELLGPRRQG
ncbi:MAG: PAS domain S-box protein [Acidobacteria bacterium]|nr:PAS domain S-box protein [Acidobacteriota bacterium]